MKYSFNFFFRRIAGIILTTSLLFFAVSCGSKINSENKNEKKDSTTNNNPFTNIPKTKIHQLDENVLNGCDEKTICTTVKFNRTKGEKKELRIIFPFNNQTGKISIFKKDDMSNVVAVQNALSPIISMEFTLSEFADGHYLALIDRKDMKRRVAIDIITE